MGAAVLGASLVLLSALPAAADAVQVTPYPDAGTQGIGLHLTDKDGKPLKNLDGGDAFNTSLIGLKIIENGKEQTATAYCVELPTRLMDNTPLKEVPWDQHPNQNTKFKENAKYVNWILHNSFPVLDVEQARKAFNLPTVEKSAFIAGTQAAIWHYTDEARLDEGDASIEPPGIDEDVVAVYKRLTDPAINVGIDQEPNPTLTIDPKELEGEAGKLIGPFTVATTADKVIIEAKVPAGVTFTDKDGKELEVVKEGDLKATAETKVGQIFVKVAEDVEPGSIEFTVHVTAQLQHGRLFVASDRNHKTQSLVIAKPVQVDAKEKAKAKWVENTTPTSSSSATTTTTTTTETTTTAPTTTTTVAAAPGGGGDDDLASTGASIFVPLLVGLGLLGAGAAAMIIVRRKKTA
ncbi:TQXA domain-containing protein/LPXTG-motif cell wall-anchored protein [Saccharothrix tamanrassetensis]|uniref:TQXA domain-containing protein/LPXTG-motif cell wall-anchored protein n=1 Tax=Saccharothrix tamanrassetensis TaxID=1051531 RepID=A0A841CNN8_9PSEU|nr:thioester domain-containing protein [Saccharothrix tamanrassetensis]MBB5958919.1 TQXA domain-containing protein/LPXTG-motif cell wall-anchored protein [Saccharothrix tamanrassetensis]